MKFAGLWKAGIIAHNRDSKLLAFLLHSARVHRAYILNMSLIKVLLLFCVLTTSCSRHYKCHFKLCSVDQLTPFLQMCNKATSIAKLSATIGRPGYGRYRSSMALRSTLYMASILLIRSGDIELNPGPNDETIYPCGICSDPVTWEQDAICCDWCNTWNHKACLEMSTTLFNELTNSDTAWICPQPSYDQAKLFQHLTKYTSCWLHKKSSHRSSQSNEINQSDQPLHEHRASRTAITSCQQH